MDFLLGLNIYTKDTGLEIGDVYAIEASSNTDTLFLASAYTRTYIVPTGYYPLLIATEAGEVLELNDNVYDLEDDGYELMITNDGEMVIEASNTSLIQVS